MDHLYIRADMNSQIATGHIMRCLSIADAANAKGIKTTFILADNEATSLISSRGHDYIVLDTKWDDLDSELPKIIALVKEKSIKHILVDTYSVTYNYLSKLSEIIKLSYIDDIRTFDYPVDTVICYANYYSDLEEIGYSAKNHIMGCKYVPLREEFERLPKREISRNMKKVLILSGGSDQYHIIPQIVKTIDDNFSLQLTVVCGRYNADFASMDEEYRDNTNICILKAVSNLKDYMLDVDLAISAGGSTLYELCACGTPCITYSFADNQHNNVKCFDRDRIMRYVGDVRTDDVLKNITEAVRAYSSPIVREGLSNRMQELVDGYGATRIVDDLNKLY